jgi:transcriptional regulator with XRE-family HTH domain
MITEVLSLSPEILGFWTRCLRTAQNLSQEALAATSGLDTRTIQRIEAGKSVSIGTRRSLARGLGYDDLNVFDDPQFITTFMDAIRNVQSQRTENFRKQHPDHTAVAVSRITTSVALIRLANSSNAFLFHCDDDVSPEVRRHAAYMFDFLRDLMDISDEISFTDKLAYNEALGTMLHDLGHLGVWVYSALRSTKIVGENWLDKTPMPITIGYLTAVPKGRVIAEMMVPKRLS